MLYYIINIAIGGSKKVMVKNKNRFRLAISIMLKEIKDIKKDRDFEFFLGNNVL
jgi:hypothetical protein